MVSVEEVVNGLLIDGIAAIGRQFVTSLAGRSSRRVRENLEIATWFNTYSLVDRSFPQPSSDADQEHLIAILRSDQVQGIIQEMLAVRLSYGPEASIQKLRSAFANLYQDASADSVFDYIDEQISDLVVNISTARPAILHQIRVEAHFTRINATLEAIERHVASLEQPIDAAAEHDFLTSYRRHVIEHHGMIEPPDFERRRRVPIEDLYVRPLIVEYASVGRNEASQAVDIFQRGAIDRTVLLGDPGGGKTTASQALLYQYGRDDQLRIPFLVTLREFAAKDPPERSVREFIEYRMRTFYQCSPPTGIIERLLLTGAAFVVFDGLDELVDTSRRAEVTSIIERFCTEYPLTQVLVTSRVVGYSEARLDVRQFTILRIRDFNDARVREYVHKWFLQEEQTSQELASNMASSFLEESSDIGDLRSNPLLLALMCILYRGEHSIPRSRAEVYQRCAELLFKKWDERRRIYVELKARHLIEPALRYLAYWLLNRADARSAVTRRELVVETAQYFRTRGFEETWNAESAAEEFVDFCRGRAWVFTDVGTTAGGEQLYTFTHRTFLEYFAAYYIASIYDTPEKLAATLASRAALGEWDVIGQLAIQIKDSNIELGAERAFSAILDERRRRSPEHRLNVLGFLARCLSGVQPRSSIVRKLTKEILQSPSWLSPGPRNALASLMENAGDFRQTIEDELDEKIADLVNSGDAAKVVDGLELGCYITLFVSGAPRKDWDSYVSKNIERYRVQIIAAVKQHTSMLYIAINHSLITTEEFLSPKHADVDVRVRLGQLFTFVHIGVFAILMESIYVQYAANALMGASGLDFFRGIGLVALDILASEDGYGVVLAPEAGFFANILMFGAPEEPRADEVARALASDKVAYLGLILTIAITVEASIQSKPSRLNLRDMADTLGVVRTFIPYAISRSTGKLPDVLPDLDMPDLLNDKFREWAGHHFNFVQWRQPLEDGPGATS